MERLSRGSTSVFIPASRKNGGNLENAARFVRTEPRLEAYATLAVPACRDDVSEPFREFRGAPEVPPGIS